MDPKIIQETIEKPIFTPHYLNLDYVFHKVWSYLHIAWDKVVTAEIYSNVILASSLISIFLFSICVYSLVRMYELRIDEDDEISKKIKDIADKKKENEKKINPRWHYVLTLLESINQSDWRVAVIEADSLLEEVLKEKGFVGEGVGDLLISAKNSGYSSMNDVWDAHIVRNQIAHQGLDYAFGQNEARRVIKKYQNFLEELNVI